MILGEKVVRRSIPQLLKHPRHRLEMINIKRALAHRLGRKRSILHEPRCGIRKHTALPEVIRRLTADDHTRARGDVRIRGIGNVLVKSVHERAVLARRADLVAGAGAVAAAVVVGRVGRAAVVVAELDHNNVPSGQQGRDICEAAFVRVAAGRAAADGFVDYCRAGEVGFEVGAPACVGGSALGLGDGREEGAD